MGRSNMCNIHTAKKTERTQEEITISGNPAKPQGEDGATMLKRMNESHSPVTCWALEHWQIAPEEELLDIGCGGGATLKRMGEKITTGHLTGIDYSPVSVKTSLKTNRQDVESGKMKVRFSVDNGKRRSRRIVVVMKHCGNVSICVDKVKIYDYLNIFAAKVGKNYEVQDVLVMPPLTEVYLGKTRWYNETNEDSDRFSLYKKGDDPSEIFDIRDFKDGDRFQQIHWKLSSKTGHYMVKEGSLPLAKAVHIFIDLSAKDADEADLLIQGVYSVAMEFLSQGVPQHFIWYDNVNELIQEQLIEQEEELFWMFEDLFQCHTTKDPQELLKAYIEWESGKVKESGLYLTVSDHDVTELEGLEVNELQIMDLRRDGDTYEE